MDETLNEIPEKKLPFDNLYLISGLVHGFNKGWMYAFTILCIIFGYLGFQLITIYPMAGLLKKNGYSDPEIVNDPNLLYDSVALGIDRNFVFLMELGMFVFAFVAFYSAIRQIHKKTLTSLLTGYERFRYKRTLFAFLVWSILIIAETLLEYVLNPGNFEMHLNLTGLLFSILIAVFLMPVQSGLEELFFRGYLIQGFSQVFKNGLIPLLLTSLLFGLAHMGNPEVKEYGRPIMLFYYCSFALFMGAITLLDEGLELALGIHIANNIVSGILVSDPHSVIKSYSVLESKTTFVNQEVLIWLVMAAITFFVFWLKFRWKNFKLILK